MGYQLPERVTGRLFSLAKHGPGDVPLEFSGRVVLSWRHEQASFYLLVPHREPAVGLHVSGTNGWLHVPDFVVPFFGADIGFEVNAPIFRIQSGDFNMESHPRRLARPTNTANGAAQFTRKRT